MNNFTKEELELILSDLDNSVFSRYYGEGKYELREKIQFLIDNYDAKIIEAWHCEKCGHVQ